MRPTRIIFNFDHHCNMSCQWCYIPFGGSPPVVDECIEIVRRCARVGMTVITFGGGDPFMYEFLPQLLEVARNVGMFVHVDTNGRSVRQTDSTLELIDKCIDLLGLPLDGPDATTHDQMRSQRGHFNDVLRLLRWLQGRPKRLKINTIATRQNIDQIVNMASLIETLSPARWSIYQYWPLSLGMSARRDHEITDSVFRERTSEIRAGNCTVELNPIPLRRLTYPFVSQSGRLYLHSGVNASAYETLGSIHDDAAVEVMLRRCGPERENALGRYSP